MGCLVSKCMFDHVCIYLFCRITLYLQYQTDVVARHVGIEHANNSFTIQLFTYIHSLQMDDLR